MDKPWKDSGLVMHPLRTILVEKKSTVIFHRNPDQLSADSTAT